jgi:hypothetical protein
LSYKNDKADPGVVFSKTTDAGFEVADLTDGLRAQFRLKPQHLTLRLPNAFGMPARKMGTAWIGISS